MTKTLPVGVQVYSVRDYAEKDFAGTLAKIKEMGYAGVELAGLYGQKPAEVKAAIANAGLIPLSAHVPYVEFVADLEGTVGAYKEIGMEYVAIPYLTEEYRPGAAGFAGLVDFIPKIGEACAKAGITLLYHNHDFEFAKMPDGQYALDYLYATIPAALLSTEIDTCWVNVAGEDPAAYIRKYAGRAPIVHLKDFYMDRNNKPEQMYELIGIEQAKKDERKTFEFRPVGHGLQDVPALLSASIDAGSKWVVVEQDSSIGRTSLEAIRMSRETLAKQGW